MLNILSLPVMIWSLIYSMMTDQDKVKASMFWRTSAQVSVTPNWEKAPKILCFLDNGSAENTLLPTQKQQNNVPVKPVFTDINTQPHPPINCKTLHIQQSSSISVLLHFSPSNLVLYWKLNNKSSLVFLHKYMKYPLKLPTCSRTLALAVLSTENEYVPETRQWLEISLNFISYVQLLHPYSCSVIMWSRKS